jgi:predicted dehydrogenase
MALTRRRFFFYGTLLAGAIPAAGYGSVPSLKFLGYKSPNEKLNIASIGAGGRAADDIRGCQSENIVALADPDSVTAAATFKRYEKATKYADFRKMLDKESKNIDAVIIAIPDFMHGTAAMWCMERGKHVYVEKPLCRTIWEVRQLKAAAAKYGVVTQMGNQHVSEENTRQVCEIIWSGEIGNVTEVHGWTDRPIWPQGMTELPKEEKVPATLDWDSWLGIQEMRPYSPAYAPFKWRGWRDFGTGAVGDELIHTLGAPDMALRLTAPTSVEVIKQEGKNPYTFPTSSVTRWEFPARGAMPPVKVYWYDASKEARFRPPVLPEGEAVIPVAPPRTPSGAGARGGAAAGGAGGGQTDEARAAAAARRVQSAQRMGTVFCGDKGYLAAGGEGTEGGVSLLPASRMKDYKLPPQVLWRSPGHYVEWIMACKGCIPQTASNFNVAAPLTECVLLGAVALNFEGKLEWDSAKGIFTNNKEANKYLQPPHFRKGWSFT